MAEYVPSIWDYLAKAGGQFNQAYSVARADAMDRAERDKVREDERAMNIFAQMFGAAQTGAMNAGDFNATPMARKYGVNLAPSPRELQRNIISSPGGAPIGGFAGTSVTQLPWSDDQRRVAGLPTRDQITIEQGGAAKASVDIANAPYDKLSKELEAASLRYVDEALGPVDPTAVSPRDMQLLMTSAATRAYNAWLRDQSAQGSTAMRDSGAQNFARSFFSKAVMDRLTQMTQLRAMVIRADNSGRGQIDYLGRITQAIRAINDQQRVVLTRYPWLKFGRQMADNMYSTDPDYAATMRDYDMRDNRANALAAAQNNILTGVTPPNIDAMLEVAPEIPGANPQASSASTAGPAAGPTGQTVIPSRTKDQIEASVSMLSLIGDETARQALFNVMKVQLNAQDQQTIASRAGVKP